ncbi:VWA domain-containing protein [bacterium]|nr:VWA domain-containing protein [bacterium]
MTASPTQLHILNQADYDRYRVPSDLGSFGSLQTASGILPLQSMSLQGHISGLLYQLKLVQRFYNPYNQPLEATYIFPLPGRAAVSSFVMQTEQRRVIGRLEERGEARRQYQQAVAQGKQAALAEEERSEVFTMTVGNIPPHQFVEVEMELHGPLTFADGRAMFRFPLVVAPRYIPGTPYSGEGVGQGVATDTNAVPDASRISPPVLLPGYPNPVQLGVNIQVDTGGLIFGLPEVSMPDLLCWNEPAGFRISLQPTADRLDRDLIVRFPLPSPQMQSSFQISNGYYVLNLIPDDLHQMGPQTPRQVVTLLDRSGSMAGWKMVCARRAVGRLIDSLTDRDAFQVLNFDDRIEYLDPRKTHLRWASDRERYLALEALGKVNDRGGTEILPAIQAGVNMLRGQADPYLILITDGQVGNESEVLRWIQQNAQGIRIFTVGIDTAVNVSLLERIAQVSGGHFTLVTSEDQLDEEMLGLRRRINPPLLSRVSIQLPGAESSPASVDLFQGLAARQMGFVRGHVGHEVEVVGYARDGRAFRNRLPVTHCGGQTIEKMWARERVLELEHGFLAGWKQPAYQPAAIAQFALQHGVLCRFTAFVAVDEQSFVPGPMHQVTQAVSAPDGQAMHKRMSVSAPMQSKAKTGSLAPSPRMAEHPGMRNKPTLGGGGFFSQSPPPACSVPGGFQASDPFASPDPFASAGADPFVSAGADPFAAAPGADPFAAPGADPFASAGADPFSAPPAPDPFAEPVAFEFEAAPMAEPALDCGSVWQSVPLPAPAPPAAAPPLRRAAPKLESGPASGWKADAVQDEVQAALQLARGASSSRDWNLALQALIEALVRRGFQLNQLEPLQDLLRRVQSMHGPVTAASAWLQQVEKWVNSLLHNPASARADNFWM